MGKIRWACKCEERSKPVTERNWFVSQYKWNSGAFVEAGGEYSDYSTVWCHTCGTPMRTKAKYVDLLQHKKSPPLFGMD